MQSKSILPGVARTTTRTRDGRQCRDEGRLALVTAGFKREPAEPDKSVPDDRVAVVDLTSRPPRVLQTVHLGVVPVGVFLSPDGTHVVVNVIDGSNKPAASPFRNAHGKLAWLRVDGRAWFASAPRRSVPGRSR
jgi:hypothetical protein